MTKRIFRAICLVALAVFLASVTLIMGILYDYFSQVQQDQLRIEAGLAARGVEDNGAAYFDGLDTQSYRITWIGADGTVLFDSDSDASTMENHLERDEVKQAMVSGFGHSSRYSSTLMEKLMYSAQRLSDGSVIRLSITQNSVLTIVLGMIQPVLLVSLLAVILALVLASRVSKAVVRPLNELDLEEPLSNEGYDELSPLLRRIDSQQRQLKGQALELKQKKDEFLAVTSNMSEGLVLLNSGGTILSINNAALTILGADKSCVGEDILTVNRSLEMQKLLDEARNGQRSETKLRLSGREFQLDASPIISGGKTGGVALLLFDITERENAEQLRREFTANVSHELKTPLHSISGCAELMKNGMVKPEDTARFAGQIYAEAQRLISLVEDIIRLSRLDEGAEDMQRERIDLYTLSGSVIESLGNEAKENNISVELCGCSAFIWGVRQLVGGMIYNLCENAIKYNKEKGSVKVTVSNEGEYSVLNVSDTGIGIPPEHQSRIFERFYRVDKSHSKEVGGTGLGLSIVKHSAMVHNAKIDLQSTPGKGTSITVRFPKA